MENDTVVHTIDEEESQDGEINVIPVELVEPYDSVALASPTIHISRGKYYKQTYRPAWEDMPDFKGWLRGVQGEPTRAYCTYCQKTLHAHRLSLLKHTCTLRHQKAAQLFKIRKNRENLAMEHELQGVFVNDSKELISTEDMEDGETIVEYTEAELEEVEAEPEEQEEEEDVESVLQFQDKTIPMTKFRNNQSSLSKPPISTQVTDTTKGTPVSGLQVSLYKLVDGRWTYINEGVTNACGKCFQFVDREDFTPGRYKLHYDVDRYFENKKMETLYPFIEIVFDSNVFSDYYHIPLLLSPYGYSTYKGS